MLLNQIGFTTRKKICVSGTKKDRVVVFTTRLLQSQEYLKEIHFKTIPPKHSHIPGFVCSLDYFGQLLF